MAIAYDATSVGFTVSGTSLTFSHTCTGNRLVLLVGVMDISGATSVVTGVTYNGVGLTLIDAVRKRGIERWISLWYLINPATGANNVVITTSQATAIRGQGASYTGAEQSGVPDASSTQYEDVATTTYNHALASLADNCWHIVFIGNTGGNQAAGTGTTLRGVASDTNIMDSNSAKTPAGSVTLQATFPTTTYWGSVMITLAPFARIPVTDGDLIGIRIIRKS